jgi:predicted nucleic acid-binding protein
LTPSLRSYLFDAGVFALYFAGTTEVKPYFDRVSSGRASGAVSDVNLAEFYYRTGQKFGLQTADARLGLIRNSRIESIPTDGKAVVSAGRWKLKRPGLSLADCFAMAALESSAEVLLTTDTGLKEAAKSKAVLFGI